MGLAAAGQRRVVRPEEGQELHRPADPTRLSADVADFGLGGPLSDPTQQTPGGKGLDNVAVDGVGVVGHDSGDPGLEEGQRLVPHGKSPGGHQDLADVGHGLAGVDAHVWPTWCCSKVGSSRPQNWWVT
jgi:hypothetical protein